MLGGKRHVFLFPPCVLHGFVHPGKNLRRLRWIARTDFLPPSAARGRRSHEARRARVAADCSRRASACGPSHGERPKCFLENPSRIQRGPLSQLLGVTLSRVGGKMHDFLFPLRGPIWFPACLSPNFVSSNPSEPAPLVKTLGFAFLPRGELG